MAISRDAIVEAAIRILNSGGAEALSMRALAQELNIKASSLYWHIKGKEELYGAIAERLCADCALPGDALDARECLTELFWVYRAMLLSVRDSAAVFENSAPDTPRRAEMLRMIMEKLADMGVKRENVTTVSKLLNNYALSFTADECRFKAAPPEKPDIVEEDFDGQFLYGMQILFEGIEAMRG